jgi:hypothetical protein
MKGSFYSNKTLLGEIDFSIMIEKGVTETGMGGIWGNFSPNQNYQSIRKDIQDWNDSVNQDYSKWYSFKFNVQLENGYFVLPQGGFLIDDLEDFPNEPLIVNTVGVHSHIFEDYFIQKKPFLIEPWRKINIEEKFEFEDKYKNETGLVKKLRHFADYRWEPYFSALGFNEKTKEVFYATSNTKVGCFAVADFVKKDEKGNPTFEFYQSFDEFIANKMS